MTSSTAPHLRSHAQVAAADATLAPSVHNTQPWRIQLHGDVLDLFAEPIRHLSALDPTGREAMISVGCALMNARVSYSAAQAGVHLAVLRHPDLADPTHLAVLRPVPESATTDDRLLAALAPSMAVRHTNRRRYRDEPVPTTVVDALIAAAATEDALLVPILTADHRATVARLTQLADHEQNADPTYRAELRRWTNHDTDRFDGLDPSAVPHVDGRSEDDVPIRDFDTSGAGALPSVTHSSEQQCLLLLTTTDDTPSAWLRAGEALERVLLDLTRRGYVASLFTQPIEVDHVRQLLRDELGLTTHPMVLIRVGHAAATPATHRFPLSEVIDVA